LRVPLRKGRLFNERDRTGAPKVVLINEAAAHAFYPGENPVGRAVAVAQSGFHDRAEIVGIVGNERFNTMEEAPKPDVFISYAQAPRWIGMLFVRTSGDPHVLVDAVRREVQSLDRNIPVYDIKLMEDRIADATARTRFTALLLGIFAAVALALAAVGIYGVVAFSVAQRTREIGIRVALGAAQADVVQLVLRQGAALTASGLALGLAGAWGSTRLLRSMLYETAPTDLSTFVVISLLLATVALLATLIPAVRAAHVDPLVAFKTE
jgi:putative ABC transport system permease protein